MKAAAAASSEFVELVFDELVEDLVLEVCFPLHRAHNTRALCLNCGGVESACCDGWEVPPVGSDDFERELIDAMQRRVGELADEVVSREPGLDVFGTKPRTVAIDNFKCSHCGKKVAANRYAKHLEGCMLGGGRASARIADSGKDPSPLAKRAKQTDARASPQNLFTTGSGLPESFEDVFDPSLIV
jgi:hypothetical protein